MKNLILLSFLLINVFMLHLQHGEQKGFDNYAPRIRKSIHAMNSTERKSFFWSLKALAVLPSPKSFDFFTYSSILANPGDNYTTKSKYTPKPKCLHDILMSSHQTAAEHRSFYFISYHRHWLILYEIWLNFAHDILKGGKEKLLKHYPDDVYDNYSANWDAVFDDYKNEKMNEITELAAHYWNPTNFQLKEDILFPKQLACPKDNENLELDNMDKLLYAVQRNYGWDINLKRLVADDYEWDEKDVVQRLRNMGYFKDEEGPAEPYTHDENNMLKGKLTARTQPQGQTFYDFNNTYDQYLTEGGGGDYQPHSQERFEQYFNTYGNKERIPVTNMTDQQLFTNYGGNSIEEIDGQQKFVKRSYISKEQRRSLNLAYHITRYYNRRLPHYDYAYALFNKLNVPTYVEFNLQYKGIGVSHSMMHNYHGNPMEILGLNIYVFHGWVQCMMEMRIRKLNHEDEVSGNKKQYEIFSNYLRDYHRKYQSYNYKKTLLQTTSGDLQWELMHELRNQLKDYFDSLAKFNGSEFDNQISENYTGYYTVYEWLNPLLLEKVKQNLPFDPKDPNSTMVFPLRDYLITPNRIRSSKDFSDIYNRIYVKQAAERFQGYVDLTKFKYNFDYQIYHGPGLPTEILDDAASNIPKYLQEMRKDVQQETYDIFDSNLNDTLEFIYNDNFDHFNNFNPQVASLYNADPHVNYAEIKAIFIDYYTRYLHNVSYTFAQYPSSKKNGLYEIRMKIDPDVDCTTNLTGGLQDYNFSDSEIAELTTDGILIQHLSIYDHKGHHCHDCPQMRKLYLDTDADLLDTNLPLWKKMRSLMAGKNESILYDEDVKMPTYFSQCFLQNIKLHVPQKLAKGEKPIEVWPVRGVEQFSITVQILDMSAKALKKISGSLVVEAHVVSGANPKDIIMTSTKYIDWVNGVKFDFPKMTYQPKEAVKNDIRAYLYTIIEVGWQQTGFYGLMFKYHVPHFQAQANYKLVIDNRDGRPYMSLQDRDFYVNRRLLDNFSQTL